jgi:uncharacterized membrane protein
MGSKSQNNNLQNRPSQTIQTVAYQGLLPPPDMMEQFQKLDPNLPERIVRMAEKSIEKSFVELEIHKEAIITDLANQKTDLGVKQHEAETRRIVVEKGSKYDFRAQIIIFLMVIILLAVTVLLAFNGYATVACFVSTGGFGAIITAAIKGVSNKTKQ